MIKVVYALYDSTGTFLYMVEDTLAEARISKQEFFNDATIYEETLERKNDRMAWKITKQTKLI